MASQRSKVISLYKRLQHMGREYPGGADHFRTKCHDAFLNNRDESDPIKIKRQIARGEYVLKELEALYALKKYRAIKSRYYDDDEEAIRKIIERLNEQQV